MPHTKQCPICQITFTAKTTAKIYCDKICNNKANRAEVTERRKVFIDAQIQQIKTSSPGEIWQDVNGYESGYQISNLGRVLSKKRGLIVATRINHNGYRILNLSKNGKLTFPRVHRLMAQHFIPNTNAEYCLVDHIDRNRLNNTLSNLRWVSPKMNSMNSSKYLAPGVCINFIASPCATHPGYAKN